MPFNEDLRNKRLSKELSNKAPRNLPGCVNEELRSRDLRVTSATKNPLTNALAKSHIADTSVKT